MVKTTGKNRKVREIGRHDGVFSIGILISCRPGPPVRCKRRWRRGGTGAALPGRAVAWGQRGGRNLNRRNPWKMVTHPGKMMWFKKSWINWQWKIRISPETCWIFERKNEGQLVRKTEGDTLRVHCFHCSFTRALIVSAWHLCNG